MTSPLHVVIAEPVGDRSASAHALLRDVLQELTRTAAQDHVLTRRCGACGGPHGKPVLRHPELHVSLSSTEGLVAVAVTDAGPVGVDVELETRLGFAGFADVALAPGEPDTRRGRTWTRKEAWLKATGTGLAVDPRTIDVSVPTPGVQLYDVPVADGIACAAAVLSTRRQVVSVERRVLG